MGRRQFIAKGSETSFQGEGRVLCLDWANGHTVTQTCQGDTLYT